MHYKLPCINLYYKLCEVQYTHSTYIFSSNIVAHLNKRDDANKLLKMRLLLAKKATDEKVLVMSPIAWHCISMQMRKQNDGKETDNKNLNDDSGNWTR